MIEYILLATILNVNFVVIARMLQGVNVTSINTEKIKQIQEKPLVYCNFTTIRFIFMLLILYNSILIADDFEPVPLLLYLIYWIPVVCWFHVFYNLQFGRAVMYSSFSSKFSTILAVTFEPHPLYWVPSCLFSVYCMYISLWYKYCLPT